MKKLAFLSIIIGSLFVIIGTSCQSRTIKKNQEIVTESNTSKPVTVEKKTFILQIPKATNRGTVTVQEPDGEVHGEYKGEIDILNDGRNGQAIEIVVTVPKEDKSKQEAVVDE